MYIYLLPRCDSLIGIGKATRHHEFNNDEICPEQIVLVRLLNMQYYTYILYFWYYQIHFT